MAAPRQVPRPPAIPQELTQEVVDQLWADLCASDDETQQLLDATDDDYPHVQWHPVPSTDDDQPP
jgi:hypothetical protein